MSIPEYPKQQKNHVMQTEKSRQTFYSSFHNYGNGKWFHLKGNYWGNPCFTGPSWKKMNHPPTINFQGISHFSGRVTIIQMKVFIGIPYYKCDPGGDWHPAWGILGWSAKYIPNVLLLRSLTARPWKMMVGRRLPIFRPGNFSGGELLNFRWVPSRKLIYPQKMAFWRWFSFSQGGIC